MFATSTYPRCQAARSFSSHYHLVGVQSQIDSASPHQLVAMLFDGLIDAIAQAKGAMRCGNLEAKGRAIGRAVRIVEEGLKAGLDRNGGGSLAADLDDLYAYTTLRLTQANLRNEEAALDECVRLMQPLRDAWAAIDPQAGTSAR